MFSKNWRLRFGLTLFSISFVLLSTQAILFHEGETILKKVLYSISFIPVQALVVTLVINRMLAAREKRQRLEKMNIAIGVFFSSMGRELLDRLLEYSTLPDELLEHLRVHEDWTARNFLKSRQRVMATDLPVDLDKGDPDGLAAFLGDKQGLILDLLRNPNLLEHERFTDLLWAVSHVAEELAAREETGLPLDKDQAHLEEDLRRALKQLLMEWVAYMEHLQGVYPFLFSFALRSSPFRTSSRQRRGVPLSA